MRAVGGWWADREGSRADREAGEGIRRGPGKEKEARMIPVVQGRTVVPASLSESLPPHVPSLPLMFPERPSRGAPAGVSPMTPQNLGLMDQGGLDAPPNPCPCPNPRTCELDLFGRIAFAGVTDVRISRRDALDLGWALNPKTVALGRKGRGEDAQRGTATRRRRQRPEGRQPGMNARSPGSRKRQVEPLGEACPAHTLISALDAEFGLPAPGTTRE